jgi:hypothetical protein
MSERNRGGADEATLDDLLHAMWRERRLILGVTLVIGVLGTAAAFLREPLYDYTTVIQLAMLEQQVGREMLGGQQTVVLGDIEPVEPEPVEHPTITVDVLERAYIPQILERAASNPGPQSNVLIEPEAGVGRQLIVLTSREPEQSGEAVGFLHRLVVERIQYRHASSSRVERRWLERHMRRAQAEAEEAAQQQSALRAAIGDLEAEQLRVNARTAALEDEIDQRREAAVEQQGRDRVRAFIRGHQSLRDLLREHGELEQSLGLSFPMLLANLRGSLAESERRLAEAQAAHAEFEARLEAFHDTRALSIAQRSDAPAGIGAVTAAVLAFVSGGVLGVLVGGVAAIIRRGRRARQTASAGTTGSA